MALSLGLHEAYGDLIERLNTRDSDETYRKPTELDDNERILMRYTRTWFGLLVLEHMYVVENLTCALATNNEQILCGRRQTTSDSRDWRYSKM